MKDNKNIEGLVGLSMAWLHDTGTVADQQVLLARLAMLFNHGTPEDVLAAETALETAGFVVGYMRETHTVSISHGSHILTTAVDTN